MFVSQASISQGVVQSYNLRKRIEPVRNCRNVGKKDMKFNDVMPKMKVDPERYVSTPPFSLCLLRKEKVKLTVGWARLSKRMDSFVRLSRRRSCL